MSHPDDLTIRLSTSSHEPRVKLLNFHNQKNPYFCNLDFTVSSYIKNIVNEALGL